MEFEWDEKKDRANQRKHGVSFALAAEVFLDEHLQEKLDERSVVEERWIAVGLVDGREIVVTFTLREEAVRLISARGERTDMKEKSTGIVRFKLDPKNPPERTPEQREQLKRLREMKDEDIDYSDIPSQRGAVWTRPGALIPPGNKRQITVRLDADVLEFFKKTGTRYQSRINAALREYMKAHEKAS